MGFLDRFRRQSPVTDTTVSISAQSDMLRASTAFDNESEETTATYDNRNITFHGCLSHYDYDAILRDKQRHIYQLFELSDYYIDKDPIYRGIVKGVYATFSMTNWKLIGADEKTKRKYEEYYKRINLRDRMASILYQYFKYGNVYVYLMDDGSIISLPVHKVRISNLMKNGEPVIEFNSRSIRTDIFNQGTAAEKKYVDDEEIDERLKGYPKEVAEGVKNGNEWVQLDPDRTFVLQDLKEDWMRYAVPLIASCLGPLAKKSLIETYEDKLLNLGINSFVHVRYGNEKTDNPNLMPNKAELGAVSNVFRRAMKGSALAVTNHYAKAEVIQPDLQNFYNDDMYKYVNAEILAAGGISGIIVSGRAEDGSTFASAQVSINTADKRIELARKNFCEMMNKINEKINGEAISRSSSDKIPEFTLMPIDLSGTSKFQKTCYDLWKDGCLSTETLLQVHGFDFKQEAARKTKELEEGTYELLNKECFEQNHSDDCNESEGKVGRPEMTDDERTSDPSKAMTGKQPKPSSPEGSMED